MFCVWCVPILVLHFNLFQVKGMVQGHDRRPELGYMLARECRKVINYPKENKNSKLNTDQENNNWSVQQMAGHTWYIN